MISTLAVLALVLVTAAPAPAAKGTASGRFARSSGKTYAVVDAVAWQGNPYLSVVLSDKPFDVAAMAADGVYSEVDLYDHGASLTLNIDPATRAYVGMRTRDQEGSGADFRCEDPSMLTLSKTTDATRIAGRFKCEEHDVTFDAPILKVPGAK